MAMVVGSSNNKPNRIAHVDMAFYTDNKEGNKHEVSERTMGLEEDEMMCEDDDDLISQEFIDFVRSCVEEEEDDDIISSCSSMDPDDDVVHEIHDFGNSSRSTRVKFAPMVTECLTISLDEYTQDEIEDTWWTPDEQEVMNEAYLKTVERLEAGLKEKRSTPYRGLEGVVDGCYQHVMETRKAYVDTVMDELERQWRNNKSKGEKGLLLDWEKIASLAKEITKQSADEAFLIALYDEKEAGVAYLQMMANGDGGKRTRSTKSRGPLSLMSIIEKKKAKRTTSRLESTTLVIKKPKKETMRGRLESCYIRIAQKGRRGLNNVSPVKTVIKKKIEQSRGWSRRMCRR